MYSKIILKTVLFVASYAIAMPCYCEISQVTAEKLNESLTKTDENITVVDVRSGYDFKKGHVPGAINVPYNIVDKANLTREGLLVLYCTNEKCPLSNFAAKTLETAGYKNAKVLEGGIAAWTAQNFPIETAAGVEKKSAPIIIPSVQPARVFKRLADKTMGIIDVRPAAEFKIAHLPGAKNIPVESMAASTADLSKDTEWVVCDRQTDRVKAAAQTLAEKGFKVNELSGGIQVWAAKKYPMESGEGK